MATPEMLPADALELILQSVGGKRCELVTANAIFVTKFFQCEYPNDQQLLNSNRLRGTRSYTNHLNVL